MDAIGERILALHLIPSYEERSGQTGSGLDTITCGLIDIESGSGYHYVVFNGHRLGIQAHQNPGRVQSTYYVPRNPNLRANQENRQTVAEVAKRVFDDVVFDHDAAAHSIHGPIYPDCLRLQNSRRDGETHNIGDLVVSELD